MDGLSPEWVWGSLFAIGAAYEAWGLRGGHSRREHTLSETTRDVFRTRTRVGKWCFIGGFLAFTAWFVPHIAFEVW